MSDEPKLTPTEDLVMEVLAARWRLGEGVWTFDSKVTPAVRKLEEKGLVNMIHGTVENSVRASLTENGRNLFVTKDYVPPVFRGLKKKHWKKLRDDLS